MARLPVPSLPSARTRFIPVLERHCPDFVSRAEPAARGRRPWTIAPCPGIGRGIPTGLMIAPILPGITDSWGQLAALMEAARGAGARHVHGFPLRLGPAAREAFLPVLEREFPDLVERYRRGYGGRVNAPKDYGRAAAAEDSEPAPGVWLRLRAFLTD